MKIVLASLTFAVLVFASSALKPEMNLETSERFTDEQVKAYMTHLLGVPETAIEPTLFEIVAVKATKSSASIEIEDLTVYNSELDSGEQYTPRELEKLFKQAANRVANSAIFNEEDWNVIFSQGSI